MHFFLTAAERRESHSSCYHEFFHGHWDEEHPVFWSEDSLNIGDDVFRGTGLQALIAAVCRDYDAYGVCEISREQWSRICLLAKDSEASCKAAIEELTPWMEENFACCSCFTILGI